jgi:hypothetical protein
MTADELSKTFKEVFSSKAGEIVLDRLRLFCLANSNQNMASCESTNQTFYNLGAHSVYRYIQYQIDMKLNPVVQDCILEIEDNSGEKL